VKCEGRTGFGIKWKLEDVSGLRRRGVLKVGGGTW
jgi:hypothetical protein